MRLRLSLYRIAHLMIYSEAEDVAQHALHVLTLTRVSTGEEFQNPTRKPPRKGTITPTLSKIVSWQVVSESEQYEFPQPPFSPTGN